MYAFATMICWHLGPICMGFQVPSSTQVSKVPTFELQETINIHKIIIEVGFWWLFYAKIITRMFLRVGFTFLLDSTLDTCPKPHLQEVLSCKHPCHTWDLELVWRKSPLLCSQLLRLHKLTSSDLGLGNWDPMWSGLWVNMGIKNNSCMDIELWPTWCCFPSNLHMWFHLFILDNLCMFLHTLTFHVSPFKFQFGN